MNIESFSDATIQYAQRKYEISYSDYIQKVDEYNKKMSARQHSLAEKLIFVEKRKDIETIVNYFKIIELVNTPLKEYFDGYDKEYLEFSDTLHRFFKDNSNYSECIFSDVPKIITDVRRKNEQLAFDLIKLFGKPIIESGYKHKCMNISPKSLYDFMGKHACWKNANELHKARERAESYPDFNQYMKHIVKRYESKYYILFWNCFLLYISVF